MNPESRSGTPIKGSEKALPYISQGRINSFRRGILGLAAGLLCLNTAVVWHLVTAEQSGFGEAFRQILPGFAGSIGLVAVLCWLAGRLGDPERIREILASGMADAITLGRPLVADPDFPRKMREGREETALMELRAGVQGGCSTCWTTAR